MLSKVVTRLQFLGLLVLFLSGCRPISQQISSSQKEQLFREKLPPEVILNEGIEFTLDRESYTVPGDLITMALVNKTGHPLTVPNEVFGTRGFVFDEHSAQWVELDIEGLVDPIPKTIPTKPETVLDVFTSIPTSWFDIEETTDIRLVVVGTSEDCEPSTECPVYAAYADTQLVRQ